MYTKLFEDLTSENTPEVGGKNSSLGEMISSLKEKGIRVPEGFATIVDAYRRYIEANEIKSLLEKYHAENASLEETGETIRKVGLCGEAPSNDPKFAQFLADGGIDSISLALDSVLKVIRTLSEADNNNQ